MTNIETWLRQTDPAVADLIAAEEERQENTLAMIPSENFFSEAVREAVGSVFMHKYAEGNVGARYYEGNEVVDKLEQLTHDRIRQLFALPDDWDSNVQSLAGSNANLAVYLALLAPGDLMMAMYLPDGGHLSHGWSFEPDKEKRAQDITDGKLVYTGGSSKVNITSRMFKVIQYKTDPNTRLFNYDEIKKLAVSHRPKLLITGGTAYPRDIDYKRVREIANRSGALYMADIAHEAGLVAAGALPSPVGIADVVTMTTHKTLRSGRGAIILARRDLIKKINRGVLPGLQGGPFNNNIAGICVGLGEAMQPDFKKYATQTIVNAKILAEALLQTGFNIVSGGTDKHLVLVDLSDQALLGKKFARALAHAGIIGNANSMPQEPRGPADPSALRIGTPWLTGRGMREAEMRTIAGWIKDVMIIAAQWSQLDFDVFDEQCSQSSDLLEIRRKVRTLCARFPIYKPAHNIAQEVIR